MALPVASVQLYSLAEQFSADMNGSLDRLAAIGLKNVEAFDFVRRPSEIRTALDPAGLAAPTGHAPPNNAGRTALAETSAARSRRIGWSGNPRMPAPAKTAG